MRSSRSRCVAASYCRTPIRPNTMMSASPTATTATSNNSSDSDVMTMTSSEQHLGVQAAPRHYDARARGFIPRQTACALHTAFPTPRFAPYGGRFRRGFYAPRRALRDSFSACATTSGTQRCIAGTRTLATSSRSFARCTDSVPRIPRRSRLGLSTLPEKRDSSFVSTTTAETHSPLARESAMRALVNPATANDGGPNADLVAENIRPSFRAFRDDQHRGDDGLGDGDGSANDHDGGDH